MTASASALAANASDEQVAWVTVQSPPGVCADQWGYLAPTRLDLQRFLSSSHSHDAVAVLCLLDNGGSIEVDLAPRLLNADRDTNSVERWLADDLPGEAHGFPRVGLGTTPLPVVLRVVDPVSGPLAGWQWFTTHRWSDFVVASWNGAELLGR